MQSYCIIIGSILKRCRIKNSEENIHAVLTGIEKLISFEKNLPYSAIESSIYEFLHERTDHVLYFEAYLTDKIINIIIYLVVDRLTYKNIDATKRQVHEICYYASQLFKEDKAESYSHAVNSAVKVFQTCDWFTPYGFLEEFSEYKQDIDD